MTEMGSFESQFDSLPDLAGRVRSAFKKIDQAAHQDGSKHIEGECIWIQTDTDALPAHIYIKPKAGRIIIQTADRQGDPLEYLEIDPQNERVAYYLDIDPLTAFTSIAALFETTDECISNTETDIRVTYNPRDDD